MIYGRRSLSRNNNQSSMPNHGPFKTLSQDNLLDAKKDFLDQSIATASKEICKHWGSDWGDDWASQVDRELAEGDDLKKLVGFDFTKPTARNEKLEK